MASPTTLRELGFDATLPSSYVGDLCQIINSLGTGQHPYADRETVGYFAAPYVLRVLRKAVKISERPGFPPDKALSARSMAAGLAAAIKTRRGR